jgi:hypothetical protein
LFQLPLDCIAEEKFLSALLLPPFSPEPLIKSEWEVSQKPILFFVDPIAVFPLEKMVLPKWPWKIWVSLELYLILQSFIPVMQFLLKELLNCLLT